MPKLLLQGKTIFLFSGGHLKRLGDAVELKNVQSDIFQIEDNVYLKKGEKLECIATNAIAWPVRSSWGMPPNINVKKIRASRSAVSFAQIDPALYDKFWKFCDFKTQKNPIAADNAVVIVPKELTLPYTFDHFLIDKPLKLFLSDKGFIADQGVEVFKKKQLFLENLQTDHVVFLSNKAFIYHGRVYVQDKSCFVPIHENPVLYAKNYLIFWAGGARFFALKQTNGEIEFLALDCVVDIVRTAVSDLLIVHEENTSFNNKYAIYNLGKTFELVTTFSAWPCYDIDKVTGCIFIRDYYLKEDANGKLIIDKDGETTQIQENKTSIFVKDHYETKVVRII